MSKPLKEKDIEWGNKYYIKIINNSYNLRFIKKDKRKEFTSLFNDEYIYSFDGVFYIKNKFKLVINRPSSFDSFSDTEFIIKEVYKWDKKYHSSIKSVFNFEDTTKEFNSIDVDINCYIFEANAEYNDTTEFILK